MNIRQVLKMSFIACGLMVAMVANAKEATPSTNDSIYTEDKQNIIVSPKSPEFTLKLKSNPTTGYAWFLRGYDANVITPVKHRFQKATDEKLMGAPGYELWTFKVKPAGFIVPQQTTIRLIYSRAWQGNDGSTQLVFRITTQK